MKPLAIPTTKGQVLICLIGTFPKGTINNGRREEASRIIQQSANNRATLSSIRSHWPKLLPTIDPSTRQHLELVRILNNQIKYSKLDAIYLPAVTPAFDEARLGQPKKYVSDWDSSDKIAGALSRSGQHRTGELREMVEQLVSPTNIAIVVGFLLAVAAAHALGAPGAAIDAVLIGIAWVSAGWAGINAVIDFITTTVNVLNAKSEADIDKAAKEYAHSFTLLGTAFLARFLGKVKAGKAGNGKAPVKALAKGASKHINGKTFKPEAQRPKKMQPALDKMPKSFQKEHAAAGSLVATESNAARGLSGTSVVSPARAEAYLIKNGMSLVKARAFIDSFDGPITARIVRPGEDFVRYFDEPFSTGSFLGKTRFSSSNEAIDALALEGFPNLATSVQRVTSTGRTIVFEGGIKGGGPGVIQTVIPNQNAFFFGPGVGY